MPIQYRKRYSDLSHGRSKATLLASKQPPEALLNAAPATPSSERDVIRRNHALTESLPDSGLPLDRDCAQFRNSPVHVQQNRAALRPPKNQDLNRGFY